MSSKNNEVRNVIKRLDRVEECLEVIVNFFYRYKNYMEESDVSQNIEFATGLTEKMFEERTGLDCITGEKLDKKKEIENELI